MGDIPSKKSSRATLKFFFWNTNPSGITTSSPAMWLQKLRHHNKHPNYFNLNDYLMHKEFKILIAHTFVHRLLLQISRFFKIIFFCACATLCELETEIITVTHVPKRLPTNNYSAERQIEIDVSPGTKHSPWSRKHFKRCNSGLKMNEKPNTEWILTTLQNRRNNYIHYYPKIV